MSPLSGEEAPWLLAVMGPTASGKTALAEALAEELDAQLVNADAFQIYRGMDVGTAKPERKERYQLLDIRDPREGFGVGEFVALGSEALAEVYARRRSAVVVGGTGLYVRALFEGYEGMRPAPDPALRDELEDRLAREGLESLADELQQRDPEAAAKLDLRNPARVRRALERALDPQPPLRFSLPPFRKAKLALVLSADAAERRIAARLEAMLEAGWVEEVRALREAGVPREAPGMRAIGYRSLWDHVVGVSSLAVAAESIRSETRRYAKRQRTWLRSEPNLTVWEGELTAEQALRQVKERFRL
jgi:tRNA dimethylallyltransferase